MSEGLADKRPRRVLHIGKYFPPHRGGMETVLRDQMNMQSRDEGLQVAAVVHSSERRFTDTVEISELGYRVRRSARWFTSTFTPISPFFWLSVLKEIRELDPDEIKIHMPNLSAFWLLLMPSARKPRWVVLWHSDVVSSNRISALNILYWAYRPFEHLLLERADVIAATSSEYLRSSLPLQAHRGKCVVEHISLDPVRFPSPFRLFQPPRLAEESLRVLCVGRLTHYKNYPSAIRAIAQIPNAHLRIVGDGDDREEIEALITELNVSKRVNLLGSISDEQLWKQYAWCDVHLLPSVERTEALGMVIMEAATFGKPSIVRPVPGSGVSWLAKKTGGTVCTNMGDESMLAALRSYISSETDKP